MSLAPSIWGILDPCFLPSCVLRPLRLLNFESHRSQVNTSGACSAAASSAGLLGMAFSFSSESAVPAGLARDTFSSVSFSIRLIAFSAFSFTWVAFSASSCCLQAARLARRRCLEGPSLVFLELGKWGGMWRGPGACPNRTRTPTHACPACLHFTCLVEVNQAIESLVC